MEVSYPLPRLKADTERLFELYHNNILVDTRMLQDTFGISNCTAIKVVKKIKYLIKKDDPEYIVPKQHIVPVRQLFKYYNWDIRQINYSMKILKGD